NEMPTMPLDARRCQSVPYQAASSADTIMATRTFCSDREKAGADKSNADRPRGTLGAISDCQPTIGGIVSPIVVHVRPVPGIRRERADVALCVRRGARHEPDGLRKGAAAKCCPPGAG